MSIKIKNIVTISLIATLWASCTPAASIVPTATMMLPLTSTPILTPTPISMIPTEPRIEPQLDQEIQIKIGKSVTLEEVSPLNLNL
jgi:hypothetical protein